TVTICARPLLALEISGTIAVAAARLADVAGTASRDAGAETGAAWGAGAKVRGLERRVRDDGVRANQDRLGVEAGLVPGSYRCELDVAVGRHENRVEVSLDRLIPRSEHADEHVGRCARLLNRAAEDEIFAHVDLVLAAGVVDLEHRGRLHHQGSG